MCLSHWYPTIFFLPCVPCYWLRPQEGRFRRFSTVDQNILQALHPHPSEPLGTMPKGRPPDRQYKQSIVLCSPGCREVHKAAPDANCTQCMCSLICSSVVVVDLDHCFHLSCCTLHNVSPTYTPII